jgi:hypothetical protein
METSKLFLVSQLRGLESIRASVDAQIMLVKQQLGMLESEEVATPGLRDRPDLANDPTFIGYDSLGRVNRKRQISEELRERKRNLIKAARQKKLDRLRALKQRESQIAAPASTPSPAISDKTETTGKTKQH